MSNERLTPENPHQYTERKLDQVKDAKGEALSGSKKAKNKNHSRANHGEGFGGV
ncbi:small acid-soluble spore protein P [Chengkuizengella sp. SCS-71B]|uniref:small acid-soluble spore protein P n=1 Tax=Chengkuizengella sp. SCS-71B TaxID=3115290 RepID=UPI0032C221A2